MPEPTGSATRGRTELALAISKKHRGEERMRVLVMGGGVVGVTTAYQLQKDGHEVVLLERRSDVAEETSWGNAGMIAPGHSFVWSSPKAPWILLKSLFLEHQALRFKFSADPR